MKKFVAVYDLHYGYELTRGKGESYIRPVHSTPALDAFFQFLPDFKPDVFIFGGDTLNMGFVSHHFRGKPRRIEGFRAKDEFDEFNRCVLSPVEKIIGPSAEKVWIFGNHEHWEEDFLDEHAMYEGVVEHYKYLRLKERGWRLVDYGEVYSLGKLNFAHGDVVLRGGGGYIASQAAKKAVERYGKNIRIGHRHTYQAHTQTTCIDEKDFHTGLIVPCMCTRSPEYIRNNPNDFITGFLCGYVEDSGFFTDYVVVINQGRFIWGGKVYGDNKYPSNHRGAGNKSRVGRSANR
jgi:hypothetical protein